MLLPSDAGASAELASSGGGTFSAEFSPATSVFSSACGVCSVVAYKSVDINSKSNKTYGSFTPVTRLFLYF